MNFKNFGDEPPGGGGAANGRLPNIFPLARQSSVYSLTFDEFQSSMGGSIGKDFGSMNMDELLKNIWSAEETQQIAGSTSGPGPVGPDLQRQGSLTLPRTLSQKTVDEVWKDLSGGGMTNLPPRQQTLGEVTLEEFLFRAGIVREEPKVPEKPQNFDLLGDLTRPVTNQPLEFGFQNMGTNRQQPIFPKQPAFGYANPFANPNPNTTQIVSPGIRTGMMGITHTHHPSSNGGIEMMGLADPHHPSSNGGLGMIGNGVTVATDSPSLSSDGIGKNNGDNSSVSPVPYMFTGGLRGRRSNNAVEKVIERRQRRMIKNRESAARSRARKQAYTTELEAEVAKLKQENEKLQKKQEEIMEMQKNQVFEMMTMPHGGKRQRLTRTKTGPW